ncbi:YcgN family cysteine cluster protein [Pseudomonas sp. NW5]|uniref:YcgN family cysteine cluster protein n=1 Tax=Pseudomonas sp. NW5 TaxID=2934934 RepID=UPI0020209F4D|nr:YcgN family cysteine cluster protein [Pseudomonas sp. NW5]MCL7462622.1 YcgN family cysteine cluster protein [Pseudomonas sp. NW5]
MTAKQVPFWERKMLAEMSEAEWESLCDGCGLCCLHKLEDEEDGSVYYTRIACKLLDLQSCRCSDYAERHRQVPDCIRLTPAQADQFNWLPATCAYRLLAQGQPLPDWHHLVCGDPDAVHAARISQAGRMLREGAVAEEDWEEHLIFRAG